MACRQAIIWTNAGILLIGPLGTNFSEILITIETFSFKKMHLKILSAKWRAFCIGLNVLTTFLLLRLWLSHCMYQCWLIVNVFAWHTLKTGNVQDMNSWYSFKNTFCKITIFLTGHWVKSWFKSISMRPILKKLRGSWTCTVVYFCELCYILTDISKQWDHVLILHRNHYYYDC